MKQPCLEISDLHVKIADKAILKGVNLTIQPGEIHALMGRNGAGKSTLAHALMGNPAYEVTGGSMHCRGVELSDLRPEERAKQGVFLAFQYPTAIPGVTVANFLRAALKAQRGTDIPVREFRTTLLAKMAELQMDQQFATRYVNDGFSGGEKKWLEILQLSMLEPKLCILDETDSGLDIDALRIVSEGVNRYLQTSPETGILLVTHYQRILDYIQPHFVHVMIDGKIVQSGGPELAKQLEAQGYEWVTKSVPETMAASEGVLHG